jgi:hypothetical protein
MVVAVFEKDDVNPVCWVFRTQLLLRWLWVEVV